MRTSDYVIIFVAAIFIVSMLPAGACDAKASPTHVVEEIATVKAQVCAKGKFIDGLVCYLDDTSAKAQGYVRVEKRCDNNWNSCRQVHADHKDDPGEINTDVTLLFVQWPPAYLPDPHSEADSSSTVTAEVCGASQIRKELVCVLADNTRGLDGDVKVERQCDPAWEGCRRVMAKDREMTEGWIDTEAIPLYMAWPPQIMPEHPTLQADECRLKDTGSYGFEFECRLGLTWMPARTYCDQSWAVCDRVITPPVEMSTPIDANRYRLFVEMPLKPTTAEEESPSDPTPTAPSPADEHGDHSHGGPIPE